MADVQLKPMTADEYARYEDTAVDEYAQEITESGSMSRADAMRKAADDFRTLLPDGLGSAGHSLFTAWDGDTEVGRIWLRVEQRDEGLVAFVYDVKVHADMRRRGYGRAVMLAAEDEARTRGAVFIGLNVFGSNTGARALYDQLGYEVTSTQMRKRLAGG